MIRSDFDAVIIGSGCAGSWAAKELTEAGHRVLILEAGGLVAPETIPDRFPALQQTRNQSWSMDFGQRYDWNLDGATMEGNQSSPNHRNHPIQRLHPSFVSRGSRFFVDDYDSPYVSDPPGSYAWIRGMQLGGRSVLWGGTALRQSPFLFSSTQESSRSPTWPIKYEELAPWYEKVEARMGVVGVDDGLPEIPGGAYSTPIQILTQAEQHLLEKLRSQNRSVTEVRYVPDTRDNQGWPKYTMQASALADAISTGLLQIRTNAIVTQVNLQSESGLATGVHYLDTELRSEFDVSARIVFLCCGTIESTVLLLSSFKKQHMVPNEWLGKGLVDHPVISAEGVLESFQPSNSYDWSARQRGLIVPFSSGIEGGSDFGIWVTLQRRSLDGLALGNIDAQGEMQCQRKNRIELSDQTDCWGRPRPKIICGYGPEDDKLYSRMCEAIYEIAKLANLRVTSISKSLPTPGLNVHDTGTARMGHLPSLSVVNRFNQLWQFQNVFVTDGSAIPISGWQNPTLTIMALSARAGGYASELLQRGVF